MELHLKRKNVFRGVRLFLILTIAGIAVVFYLTGSQQTWRALRHFHWGYFFLASLLIGVDLYSGALRIYIFVRKIVPSKTFFTCFKANLANIFLAAATPFQTGGGVAQLYVLNRNGIPYSAGITVSVLNFVATLSMLLVAALFILTTVPENLISNHSLFVIMDMSKLAFYVTFLGFTLFLVRPVLFEQVSRILFRILTRCFPSRTVTLSRIQDKFMQFIHQYNEYLRFFWIKNKSVLVWNYALTILLYFNKCLVAFVIFKGLGLAADFWEVVMLQMLIVFFLYFAPTPGASFIAETSSSAIMSLIAPPYLLTLYSVLWRFFTTYFGVFLGSFVLIKLIGRAPLEKATESVVAEK